MGTKPGSAPKSTSVTWAPWLTFGPISRALYYRAIWADRLETGWTEPHRRDRQDPMSRKAPPCQGEGRGFESRLPLSHELRHRLPQSHELRHRVPPHRTSERHCFRFFGFWAGSGCLVGFPRASFHLSTATRGSLRRADARPNRVMNCKSRFRAASADGVRPCLPATSQCPRTTGRRMASWCTPRS
jgi:hypothetical protein